MDQDRPAEVEDHRLPGHRGRRTELPLGGSRRPHVEVVIALRRGLRGAQRPFVGRQPQPGTVGELDHPAVQERPVVAGQAPLPVGGREPARVARDEQQKRAGQDATGRRQPPPRPHGDREVEQSRDDQHHIGHPGHRGGTQQKPGGGHRPPPRPAPVPDQYDQRGEHEKRGADVAQDVLLQVELERVEQHRDGRQRSQPAAAAPVGEDRVDHRALGQPERVLRQRDQEQRMKRGRRDEQDGIAARADRVG